MHTRFTMLQMSNPSTLCSTYNRTDILAHLTSDSGLKTTLSPNHPVLTSKFWCELGTRIQPGHTMPSPKMLDRSHHVQHMHKQADIQTYIGATLSLGHPLSWCPELCRATTHQMSESIVQHTIPTHYLYTHAEFILGLLNKVRICKLRISSSNLYSFFSPSIFESKHH